MNDQNKTRMAVRILCLVLAAIMVFGVAYAGLEAIFDFHGHGHVH